MSDHRRLHQAELVLWVGAELESFLDKPLRNLPSERSISTYDLPGIQWPDNMSGEVEHHHDHSEDPHLWLNPQNAVVIAKALAVRLGQLQPAQAQLFATRAESFAQAMQILDRKLQVEMEPLKSRGFAVYHEGYAHFVAHYGLHQLGYITYTPERRPGAKHTYQLRRLLEAEGVCLFIEPHQKTEHLQGLVKQLDLRLGQLNPIGDNQVKSYKELLEQMGQAFSACLAHR
jgi:zinc transport system substrate-binding protein